MALLHMQKSKKDHQQEKVKRFLITVTVLGSAGPLRFVVKEEELVATVIETALRSYAREGRYPALGSDLNSFFLYCANAGSAGNISNQISFFKLVIFFFFLIS